MVYFKKIVLSSTLLLFCILFFFPWYYSSSRVTKLKLIHYIPYLTEKDSIKEINTDSMDGILICFVPERQNISLFSLLFLNPISKTHDTILGVKNKGSKKIDPIEDNTSYAFGETIGLHLFKICNPIEFEGDLTEIIHSDVLNYPDSTVNIISINKTIKKHSQKYYFDCIINIKYANRYSSSLIDSLIY